MQLAACKAGLKSEGWYVFSSPDAVQDALATEVASLAQQLGDIVPGRGGHLVEDIVPQNAHAAPDGSLSSRYGLGPLPLHTDTAHWVVPAKYLVIACVDPGPIATPTILLDSQVVTLTDRITAICKSAVFLIRNGRRSFYGSILDKHRPFVRFDQGCMEAVTKEGIEAVEALSRTRNCAKLYHHDWKPGDILVIDNWRVLHGRGFDGPTCQGRVLLRATIR